MCLAAGACRHRGGRKAPPSASASASASATAPPVPTATDSAQPEEPPKTDIELHHVGDKAALPDYRISVVDVKECKPRSYYKPRAGNVWIGVEVTVEATTDKEVRTSPFFAHLVDSSGRGHTATFGGCKPELKDSRLAKGDHARGYITFEIPETANGLRLVYDPFVIGGGKQTVAFTIVR